MTDTMIVGGAVCSATICYFMRAVCFVCYEQYELCFFYPGTRMMMSQCYTRNAHTLNLTIIISASSHARATHPWYHKSRVSPVRSASQRADNNKNSHWERERVCMCACVWVWKKIRTPQCRLERTSRIVNGYKNRYFCRTSPLFNSVDCARQRPYWQSRYELC